MKKIKTSFLLLICILSGLFIFSSCKKEMKLTENNEKIEEMITNDYIQFYWPNIAIGKTDGMYIKYFLGIYDDLYVATFYDWHWRASITPMDIIDEFIFQYPETKMRIVIWRNHNFLELKEAYDQKVLNLEQIEKIHKEYLKYEWTEEVQTMLKEDYLKLLLLEYPNAVIREVYLYYKLGCYDSMYVGIFGDAYSKFIDYTNNYSDVSQFDKESIGGHEFVYPNTNRIQVWKDHQFYLLKEAYEKGIIQEEQLDAIHKEYNKTALRYRRY